MSWDLIVFSQTTPVCDDPSGMAHFPDGWDPDVIGTRAQLRARISGVFPETAWSNPGWGLLAGAAYSLEFAIGDADEVRTFTIFARGTATPPAMHLIARTGWKILETGSGTWLNGAADPDHGRQQFQRYLDKVVERDRASRKRGWLARLWMR